MSVEHLSYAAIHRLAVREAERRELGRLLDLVRVAKHAVVARHGKRVIYCYGDLRTCENFAAGLERDVRVVEMTDADRERESVHLCNTFR